MEDCIAYVKLRGVEVVGYFVNLIDLEKIFTVRREKCGIVCVCCVTFIYVKVEFYLVCLAG